MDDTIRTPVPRSGDQPTQPPYNQGPPRPPSQTPSLNGARLPFQQTLSQQNLIRPQGAPPQQPQPQQRPLGPQGGQPPQQQQQQQPPRPQIPNQGQQPQQQFPPPQQGGVRPPLQQQPSQQFLNRPPNPNGQPILNPNPNIRGPPQQQIQPQPGQQPLQSQSQQPQQQQQQQQQQGVRNPQPGAAPQQAPGNRPPFSPQNPNQPQQQFRPPFQQQPGAPGAPSPQQQQQPPLQNLNRPNLQTQNQAGVRPGQPGQPRPPFHPGQPLQNQPSLEHIKSPLGRESPDRNNRMATDLMADKKAESPRGGGSNYSPVDDDDDVVIGRALTPNKPTPVAKSPDFPTHPTPRPPEGQPLMRNDSSKSIPSRPPSGLSSYGKTSSPEPVLMRSPSQQQAFDRQKSPSPEQAYSRPSSQLDRGDRMKQSSPDSSSANRPPSAQDPYAPAAAVRRTPSEQLPQPNNRFQQQPHANLEGMRTTPPNMMRANNPDVSKSPSPDSGAGYPMPRQPGALNLAQQQQSAGRMRSPNQPQPPSSAQSPKSPINLSSIINPERVHFSLPNEQDEVSQQQQDMRPKKLSMDRQYEKKKGDNDSGVDESTQEKERNGPLSPASPVKSPTKIPGLSRPSSITPQSRSRSQSKQRASLKTPETPVEPIKKVPMNKIQVGGTPSPNLKVVKSKIGSLQNATHKPGGGNVKIETKKIDIKVAAPRIEAKNENYQPKGGDKKIISNKLQWTAKSKIGSLENASHKPGGGDKKIESIKTDFNNKAKPKIGSKDNLKYQPGGGDVKASSAGPTNPNSAGILNQKIEIKAESKIGSLDNVKHKPGGGDKKIFDDKEYLRQIEHPIPITPPAQSPMPSSSIGDDGEVADENSNQQY